MTTYSPEYYAELEEMLRALMPEVRSSVDLETWRWYEEYVRAGEYGLALETVMEKIVGQSDGPLPLVAKRLVDAADRMGLTTGAVTRVKQRLGQTT